MLPDAHAFGMLCCDVAVRVCMPYILPSPEVLCAPGALRRTLTVRTQALRPRWLETKLVMGGSKGIVSLNDDYVVAAGDIDVDIVDGILSYSFVLLVIRFQMYIADTSTWRRCVLLASDDQTRSAAGVRTACGCSDWLSGCHRAFRKRSLPHSRFVCGEIIVVCCYAPDALQGPADPTALWGMSADSDE